MEQSRVAPLPTSVFVLVQLIFLILSENTYSQTTSNTSLIRRYFSQAATAKANQDYQLAISLINKVLSIDGKNADAYGFKAECEIFTDMEAALVDINRSIGLNPNFAESYHQRGIIERLRNNYTNALDDYSTAIKKAKNSEDLSSYYFSRATLREDLLDHTGALKDCNLCLELNGNNNWPGYNLRGSIKLNLGDFRGALEDCNKSIEIAPGADWSAYYTRGIAQAKLGNTDNACTDLGKASELTQSHEVLDAIKKYCP